MIAYVSGEAKRAVLLRASKYYGFSLDGDREISIRQEQIPRYLMHSRDVEEVQCSDIENLIEVTRLHFARDRALRCALNAVDFGIRLDLRERSAMLAEGFLHDHKVLSFVRNRFYSAPLPDDFSMETASSFLQSLEVPVFEEFFDKVCLDQELIRTCVEAWNELPDDVFGVHDRHEFKARAIKSGAFYRFVSSEDGVNYALLDLLNDTRLRGLAVTREIVKLWGFKFKSQSRDYSYSFDHAADLGVSYNSGLHKRSNFEAYQSVKKQIGEIKRQLLSNRDDRVSTMLDELIRYQSSGELTHLSKSLCDLASFAKGLGDIDKSLYFLRIAVEKIPEDAWAHVQIANNYVEKAEPQLALEHFRLAEVYGDERSAMIGRAEVLKNSGNRDAAIEEIENCIDKYPGEIVAINSRASILAHFGLLEQAGRAYNAIIDSNQISSYSFSGRAGVLHDMGRFDEAFADQEVAISLAKDDPVPHVAMADMLRERGRFSEALSYVANQQTSAFWRLQSGLCRARIFRDSKRFDEACSLLNDLAQSFPHEILVFTTLAEIEKRRGALEKALSIYEEVERRFGSVRLPRVGMSATYLALGRPEDAAKYLPDRRAATYSDWIGVHVRGMLEFRFGSGSEARELFQSGLNSCPWKQQLGFFKAGLALVELRDGQADAAIAALGGDEKENAPLVRNAIDLLQKQAIAAAAGFSLGHDALQTDDSVLGRMIADRLVGPSLFPSSIAEQAAWCYLLAIA